MRQRIVVIERLVWGKLLGGLSVVMVNFRGMFCNLRWLKRGSPPRKLTASLRKMDGWKSTFLLGCFAFSGAFAVSFKVPGNFSQMTLGIPPAKVRGEPSRRHVHWFSSYCSHRMFWEGILEGFANRLLWRITDMTGYWMIFFCQCRKGQKARKHVFESCHNESWLISIIQTLELWNTQIITHKII